MHHKLALRVPASSHLSCELSAGVQTRPQAGERWHEDAGPGPQRVPGARDPPQKGRRARRRPHLSVRRCSVGSLPAAAPAACPRGPTPVSAAMRVVPGVTRRGAPLTRVEPLPSEREEMSMVQGMMQVVPQRAGCLDGDRCVDECSNPTAANGRVLTAGGCRAKVKGWNCVVGIVWAVDPPSHDNGSKHNSNERLQHTVVGGRACTSWRVPAAL